MTPQRTRHRAFGDVAAVWEVMTRSDASGIVDAVTGGKVAGAVASRRGRIWRSAGAEPGGGPLFEALLPAKRLE